MHYASGARARRKSHALTWNAPVYIIKLLRRCTERCAKLCSSIHPPPFSVPLPPHTRETACCVCVCAHGEKGKISLLYPRRTQIDKNNPINNIALAILARRADACIHTKHERPSAPKNAEERAECGSRNKLRPARRSHFAVSASQRARLCLQTHTHKNIFKSKYYIQSFD